MHPKDVDLVEAMRRQASSIEVTDLDDGWVTGIPDDNYASGINPEPQLGLGIGGGYIWVHQADGRAVSRAIVGDRMIPYKRTAGKRCQVGLNNGGERIAYALVNDDKSAQSNAEAAAAAQQATPVPAINIAVGRVTPSPNGGFEVCVDPIPQVGWTGGYVTADSADLPATAGEFGWWVWYWPDGGTEPTYAVTTPVTTNRKENLLVSDARAAALPAGSLRLYALTVFNGETDILYDNTRREDLRDWLNVTGALLTGDSEAQTIAAGAITTGNKSVIVVSPTATLSTINLVGAPRLLWLIGDTGVTVTLATSGNISSAAVVTDTESVLVYHDGTTAFVLAGGSGGDATTVTYTPTTPADWPSVPTDVQEALDTLAADAVTGGINKDLYTQTTNVTVANTTTPTTLLGAGQGSSLLPANYFVAGRTLVLDFAGVRSSALVAPNITFEIDLGSTTICATATFADVSGLSGQQVHGHVEITCLTTGGSGTVNAQGWVELNSTGTVAVRAEMVASNPVTVDTTIAQQIKVLLTWGTASASNTLTNTNAKAQTVDPNAGTAAGAGAWANSNVTWKSGTNAVTLDAASQQRYIIVGKLVTLAIYLKAGSAAAASGTINISGLPAPIVGTFTGDAHVLGASQVRDQGVAFYNAVVTAFDTDTLHFWVATTLLAFQIGTSPPDEISFTIQYETP